MIQSGTNWQAGWQVIQQDGQAYMMFAALIAGALVLGSIPVVKRPLQWAETFYHELSHGLMALLTGGRPVRIELWANGQGLCSYYPGWKVPIALAGYMGAALWGGLIYLLGAHMDGQMVRLWLYFELAVLALTWLILVRKTDVRTTLVMLVIATVYAVAAVYGGNFSMSIGGGSAGLAGGVQGLLTVDVLPWVLQFMGICVLMNAIKSPLYLLHAGKTGDAADLQRLTVIVPRFVWALLWFVFGLAVMLFCACQTLQGLASVIGWPKML